MNFSEKLTALRRREGMSQEQLADRLGVTRQSVSKWEGGAAQPELAKLVALSEMFHVSVDYLVKDYMEEPERIAAESEIFELPGEHPVRAAVQKLPQKYGLVIHLFYFEELSVAEIAQLTEQKESTVKSRLHRARQLLRNLLGEEWESGG